MTDQEIIALNDRAKLAATKDQLGPFWAMFESIAGGLLDKPGDGFFVRGLRDRWKDLVFPYRRASKGCQLDVAVSAIDHLAIIVGSGESLQQFAVEQLDHRLVAELRKLPSALPAPIMSRVVAALVLIDRTLAEERGGKGFISLDAISGGSLHCDASTHRVAQRHLSELLVTYPVLICNRIAVSPKNTSGEMGPIAHAIACSRNAEFPRKSHGGTILTRSAISRFAAHPLTRIALTQIAPNLRTKTGCEMHMHGLPLVTAAFDRMKRPDRAIRPGLLASMIENSAAGGEKFPMNMVPGKNTGVSANKLFPMVAGSLTRAIMQSAGLTNGNNPGPVRYGNLNPSAQRDATGLFGVIEKHLEIGFVDERFQNVLFDDLMSRAEHFILNGLTGGSLDDRLSAFVNAIADAGITRVPVDLLDLKSGPAGAPRETALVDAHRSVALHILEFSFGPPPEIREAQLSPEGPGPRTTASVPIIRFVNADPVFAQEFMAAVSKFGVTTQDFRDQLDWCTNSSANGWRHAIDIVETRDVMRAAIAAATVAATATATATATTAATAGAPESRRSMAALRL